MKRNKLLIRLLLLALIVTAIPCTYLATAQNNNDNDEAKSGLQFRLSEGIPAVSSTLRLTPSAPATILSDQETKRLLERLPAMKPEPADKLEFKLRPGSLPPPIAGQIIQAAFVAPAPGEPATVAANVTTPLQVLRFEPDGAVFTAPSLSITFSLPMVSISSQAEAATVAPVTLSPQPKGVWRWLGAQVLSFQPEGGRFPMATTYAVTIPAGTRSALGNVLPEANTFTFSTPPPSVDDWYPTGSNIRRDSILYLHFDQRIDADRVFNLIAVEANGQPLHIRRATAEEIAANDSVRTRSSNARAETWFAVRAINADGTTLDALPANSSIKIKIPAGLPSEEGPHLSAAAQVLELKTIGPFAVTNQTICFQEHCSPYERLYLTTTNRIDPATFRPEDLTITPAIPGGKITVSGNVIGIEGLKRSNTDYRIILPRTIQDELGQSLSGENSFVFKITTAPPRLYSPNPRFMTLDPRGARTFNIYNLNYRQIRVRLSKLTPADWPRYQLYLHPPPIWPKDQPQPCPPGTVVFDRVLELNPKLDELTETAIDLSPALTNGYGQVFVQIEPVEKITTPVRVYAYSDGQIESWVQATDIGLDAFSDRNTLGVWANSLLDGKPLAGTEIQALPYTVKQTTGANGWVLSNLDRAAPPKDVSPTALMVARRGDDLAIMPPYYSPIYQASGGDWRAWHSGDEYIWYVFDDRSLYRPGEEVHVKGWIRTAHNSPLGDTGLLTSEDRSVSYTLSDSQNNEIAKGTAALNTLDGFDLTLKLPANVNLGDAELEFKLNGNDDGDSYTHTFKVQEFRRPEFELNLTASDAPYLVGSHMQLTAAATYYTGGGLADATVEWSARAEPASYTPPGRDDFVFGVFCTWWTGSCYEDSGDEQTFTGKTDAGGMDTLRIDLDSAHPARPSIVTVEAKTQDVNRQELSQSTRFWVHPADTYVGIKAERTFVQPGQPFETSLIATDIDGKAVAGREIRLRSVRLEKVYENHIAVEKEIEPQEQTLISGRDAIAAKFNTSVGGSYRLTAQIRDQQGRLNKTEILYWVAGGKSVPSQTVEQEKVQLIPDRKTYDGGQMAEVLVQSPFAPAEGVLTIRRSGLLRTVAFSMTEDSYTLRVPLDDDMTPNVEIQVDLVGQTARSGDTGEVRTDLPTRPAYASGSIKLDVSPAHRRLTVTATPRDAILEPGGETTVDVDVKDAKGKGVAGTDTAVVVVDESVLALAGYRIFDPVTIFYPDRSADVNDYHSRDEIKLLDPQEIEVLKRSPNSIVTIESGASQLNTSINTSTELPLGGRDPYALIALAQRYHSLDSVANTSGTNVSTESYGYSVQGNVRVRNNFNALATFVASVPTDARGRAQVKVKLPDNLTRYRILAYSVAGGQLAGWGTSVITARKQLMARPSAPRFLNFGDRAELPVVVQNQTDKAMKVNVAVRATNAELTAGGGRSVTVPANDRTEIRFPIAAGLPGVAQFQIVTAAGKLSDAAEVSLPVYTPATTESMATYGVIDQGSIAQPVQAPPDAVKSYGGLEVTTASTQLQELTDAVIYLVDYPYDCSEQISSRLLALAALKDVLTAFNAKDLPTPAELQASVDADIKRLQGLQNDDGGFDFWTQGKPSVPFVSVHVAHALVRAKEKGYAVPDDLLDNAKKYLSRIEARIPQEYSPESHWAIRAYALYVRNLMKDPDPVAARKLLADAGGPEKMSLESLGWILPVLSPDHESSIQTEAIRRHLNNSVVETAGAAHFADAYSDGAYSVLYSGRRTDGVLLDALIGDQPNSDLIPKLVRGLLSGRRRGHWLNTQENVFILLSLDRYFNTYEKATPDFTARVWLGQSFAGDQIFKGRSIDKQQLNLPMSALAETTAAGPANLTIAKEGSGRLYYRIGTKFAPKSLNLAAADYGFKVNRVYEAVDDPTDVHRDVDGTWVIKAGARVRVRVTMSNPSVRYHVALVDPLPAGLEILNPELASTEALPEDKQVPDRDGYYWSWRSIWYEHQNLRDDRAEAFTYYLWEGDHVYSYFARATTPGLFVVPPPKAEEMYSPETFGRGHSDKVRIE